MSNARKILLVDGDPAVRKSFEQVLSGKGYAVVTVSSGEDALWQLGNETFDAVFTEIVLRGMSGLDVVEEIHASQPRLPVVIVTGDGSGTARERAAAAGVVEFLRKPLSPEQLADIADRVLRPAESVVALQHQTAVAEVAPSQATPGPASRLKDVGLFLLAPFIALVYLLAFPVLALGMAIWQALRPSEETEPLHPAAPAIPSVLKTIAMMLAAVFVGVIFAVIGPIIGIGFLIWFGFQAWGKLGAKAMAG